MADPEKLFAIHSIKRTVTPAEVTKDAFGNERITRRAVTTYIKPGTIFDPLDENEALDLKRLSAARTPTARELTLDRIGLLTGESNSGTAPSPVQKTQAEIDAEQKAQADEEAALAAAAAKKQAEDTAAADEDKKSSRRSVV